MVHRHLCRKSFLILLLLGFGNIYSMDKFAPIVNDNKPGISTHGKGSFRSEGGGSSLKGSVVGTYTKGDNSASAGGYHSNDGSGSGMFFGFSHRFRRALIREMLLEELGLSDSLAD